jgi:chromate reductase
MTIMDNKKNILVINGSASAHSSNERLIERFRKAMEGENEMNVWPDLKSIPHFDPDLAVGDVPAEVGALRQAVERSDGVVICTPEYIFSIPSGLKNVVEWCVATTVFTDKPVGIITASANGEKAHEELQLIMQKIMAKLSDDTTLLIAGVKGKIDNHGEFTDEKTQQVFERFVDSFKKFLRG